MPGSSITGLFLRRLLFWSFRYGLRLRYYLGRDGLLGGDQGLLWWELRLVAMLATKASDEGLPYLSRLENGH